MKITLDNITLSYSLQGKGHPLILLHGNGENHHIFDKLVSKLKNDFTVYAIDSRNHGESSQTDDYSYATMANDIFRFIEKLNLKDVSIVGFSDGAIISLLMAIENKNIFRKMVLLGVNLKPSDFTDENYAYLIEEYNNTHDPLVKLMLEQPDIELDQLKDIHIPTLVISAEDDLYKPEIFEEITDTLPNAQSLIMKGHDHASYVINQDILYHPLQEFLY